MSQIVMSLDSVVPLSEVKGHRNPNKKECNCALTTGQGRMNVSFAIKLVWRIQPDKKVDVNKERCNS